MKQQGNATYTTPSNAEPRLPTDPQTPIADTSTPAEQQQHQEESAREQLADTDVNLNTSDEHDQVDDSDPLLPRIRRAVGIMREGAPHCIKRAAKALFTDDPVVIDDDTIDQLQQLHPTGSGQLEPPPPTITTDLVAVDHAILFQLLKRRVDNGSAPGPSGWTGSHLTTLVDSDHTQASEGLAMLIKDICNGVFTGTTQQRLLSSILIPIRKPNKKVRPIAMGEVFVKLAAHYVINMIKDEIPSLFPRIQFGTGKAGGSESAAQLTRYTIAEASKKHEDVIAIKTDYTNAFNAASRVRIWNTLLAHHQTAKIWRLFHWCYSIPSSLLVYDKSKLHTILTSSEGVRQGDVFAALGFALCVQSLYENSIKDLPDVHAISVQDDLTLIGPKDQVFEAFNNIKNNAAAYHLNLCIEKCITYLPPSLPEHHVETCINMCNNVGIHYADNMESLGVRFGNDDIIRSHCLDIIHQHQPFFDALCHPSMPVQIGYTLLRYCGIPRLSYLTRTVHPSILLPLTNLFDHMVIECFHKMMQTHKIAQVEYYQHHIQTMCNLPLAKGGLGIRPMFRTSIPAYFAATVNIIPEFMTSFPPPQSIIENSEENNDPSTYYLDTQLFHDINNYWSSLKNDGVGTSIEKDATIEVHDRTLALHGPHVPERLFKKAYKHAEASIKQRSQQIENSSNDPSIILPIKPFMQDEHIQTQIMGDIEDNIYQQHHQSATPYYRTVMTASTARNCSTYLTTIPTEHNYNIDNDSLRLAVRHRLGIPPNDSLILDQCICSNHTEFIQDSDHFHACVATRSDSLTMRHDMLVHCIADLAEMCKFIVQIEPTNHIRPGFRREEIMNEDYHDDHFEAIINNHIDPNMHSPPPPHWHRHADLLLIRNHLELYIDVSVLRPTNASQLKANQQVQDIPCIATTQRVQHKNKKYKDISTRNNYQFYAFVIETYGGYSKPATNLLSLLSEHCQCMSPKEFLKHAYQRISICLQEANAKIGLLGQQKLRMKRMGKFIPDQYKQFRKNSKEYNRKLKMKADEMKQKLLPIISAEECRRYDDAAMNTNPPFNFIPPTVAGAGHYEPTTFNAYAEKIKLNNQNNANNELNQYVMNNAVVQQKKPAQFTVRFITPIERLTDNNALNHTAATTSNPTQILSNNAAVIPSSTENIVLGGQKQYGMMSSNGIEERVEHQLQSSNSINHSITDSCLPLQQSDRLNRELSSIIDLRSEGWISEGDENAVPLSMNSSHHSHRTSVSMSLSSISSPRSNAAIVSATTFHCLTLRWREAAIGGFSNFEIM